MTENLQNILPHISVIYSKLKNQVLFLQKS